MIQNVITYPNKLLRQKSLAVADFGADLGALMDDMYETMIARNGVGLAAIQIAKPLRALVINLPREDKVQYKDDLLEIINPEILESSGEILFQEGCLSVPGFYEYIKRFSFIKLKFNDRQGNECVLEAQDYLAVALQHEIDHLNGVLFVDKLSILKRKKFEKEYKRLQKERAEQERAQDSQNPPHDSRESQNPACDSTKDSADSTQKSQKSRDSRDSQNPQNPKLRR